MMMMTDKCWGNSVSTSISSRGSKKIPCFASVLKPVYSAGLMGICCQSTDFFSEYLRLFIICVFIGESLQLEEKLSASERKREKAQAEIVAKQRRREEKAKRVRSKGKQIKDGDDVVDLAVDHDETYNADEEGMYCSAPSLELWIKGAMSKCFSLFSDYFEIEGNLKIVKFSKIEKHQ